MLNFRWSLLFGASLSSLVHLGCAADDAVSGPGAKGSGGSSAASGGNKGNTGGSKATGGSSTGGASATGSAPEATVDAIKAFIAAGTYKSAPWKADVDAPRASVNSGHGMVRVWFNDTIQASAVANNLKTVPNKPAVPPASHDTGSMVVKELYKDGAVIGHAAMLKLDGVMNQWAYYCKGPKAECGAVPNDATVTPYFGTGPLASPCGFCHGGNVFTPVP